MAALIRVEKEILTRNPFGSFFVGPDKNHVQRVTGVGDYPARLGPVTQGISIQFLAVEGASYIQAVLPYLHTLYIRAEDYMDSQKTEAELLAKMGGVNIGAYQIESLGGRQTYIGSRVRIMSLEAAEEATRAAKHSRSLR